MDNDEKKEMCNEIKWKNVMEWILLLLCCNHFCRICGPDQMVREGGMDTSRSVSKNLNRDHDYTLVIESKREREREM